MLRPVLHFGKNSLYKTDQIPLQNSCVTEAHLCASGAIVICRSQRLVTPPQTLAGKPSTLDFHRDKLLEKSCFCSAFNAMTAHSRFLIASSSK